MLCPTMAPHDVERIAAKLAERSLHTIDAPMSGGPARAADGSMSLMVACLHAVFQQHRTLLGDLSSKLFHISERPGDGARTKLVNNLLAGINLVGAAEVMVLAQRMGLDLKTTLNVIEQSSGQSWIGSDRMHRALAADYEPRAHMGLLAKDTALAMTAANALNPAGQGYSGPLGQAASTVFHQAMQSPYSELDDSALFPFLQNNPPA
jgi:L-threonate 2-dehydrogenase